MRKDRWFRYALLGLVVAAAGLRLFVLRQAHFVLDGDEAVSGIMARHVFTQHELALFFYGQPYMAPVDAWVAAPFLAVFSGSAWLKVGPFLWSVLLVALNGWLARQWFNSRMAGCLAAILTAFPPLYFLINTLRVLASFGVTLVLGDLLLFLVHRVVFRPGVMARGKSDRPGRLWAWLGIITGFSFYALWLAVFYYGPVFFYLFLQDKRFFLRRKFGWFLAGFCLGSLPFWAYNLAHNFETFRYFWPKPGHTKPLVSEVFTFFFSQGVPLVIGTQNTWFLTSPSAVRALTIIWLAIGAGWLITRWRGLWGWFRLSLENAEPVDMLLLLALLAPLLFWASGMGNNAFALPGVDTTGRYLLPLMAIAPLLAGGGLARVAGWRPTIGPVLAGLGLVFLLWGNLRPYRQADWVAVFQSPYYTALRPPIDNQPVIEYLHSQGIEYATCNHWVGNRLAFEAAESIRCVDYYDIVVQHGPDRFPQWTAAIQEPGRRIGFVLVNPGGEPTPLEARLRELGIEFTRQDLGPYTIIIPTTRPVAPGEVVGALGYPY